MKNNHQLLFACAFLLVHCGWGQTISCDNIKNGTFYMYPKNSNERWKMIRDGATEKDINLVTGDTSVWNVNWQSDCQYKLKYLSGGKLKKEEADLFKNHVLVLSVEADNGNYYLVDYYLDKKSKSPFLTDTVWKSERPTIDKRIFTEIQPSDVRKLRFKDTSQYALLYVYRSGKFVGSLANYLLSTEGIPMAAMTNKSAYVFKIWKEGVLHILAKTIHHEDKDEIDIQFGQKYYLQCDIKLTLEAGGRPVLNVVDKMKGEGGFLNAQ